MDAVIGSIAAREILDSRGRPTVEAELVDGLPLWRSLAGDGPVSMPLPMVNILSGGLHAGRQLDFQDFLVIPIAAESFARALEVVVAVHRATGELLIERGLSALRADEGGFGPALTDHRQALELLDAAVRRAGLVPGEDIAYALDVAASHFLDRDTGRYRLACEGRELEADELASYIGELAAEFPVWSVEDPHGEDDWAAWGQIKVGSVTQSERLAKYNQLLRIEEELGDEAPLYRWGSRR